MYASFAQNRLCLLTLRVGRLVGRLVGYKKEVNTHKDEKTAESKARQHQQQINLHA